MAQSMKFYSPIDFRHFLLLLLSIVKIQRKISGHNKKDLRDMDGTSKKSSTLTILAAFFCACNFCQAKVALCSQLLNVWEVSVLFKKRQSEDNTVTFAPFTFFCFTGSPHIQHTGAHQQCTHKVYIKRIVQGNDQARFEKGAGAKNTTGEQQFLTHWKKLE